MIPKWLLVTSYSSCEVTEYIHPKSTFIKTSNYREPIISFSRGMSVSFLGPLVLGSSGGLHDTGGNDLTHITHGEMIVNLCTKADVEEFDWMKKFHRDRVAAALPA